MLKRWLLSELVHKIEYRRGVHLTGARQVGKSTLAEMVKVSKCRRYTLDVKKLPTHQNEDDAAPAAEFSF